MRCIQEPAKNTSEYGRPQSLQAVHKMKNHVLMLLIYDYYSSVAFQKNSAFNKNYICVMDLLGYIDFKVCLLLPC